jgi:hypothetical protein
MTRLALITFLAAMLAAPAWADYDPAMEAREAAQRKAEQKEAARRKAEGERMKADANMKYQREVVGAAGVGKSDAEVTALFNQKMGVINKQAADAQKMYGGKSQGDMKNMTPQDAQALAQEMQKQYGK